MSVKFGNQTLRPQFDERTNDSIRSRSEASLQISTLLGTYGKPITIQPDEHLKNKIHSYHGLSINTLYRIMKVLVDKGPTGLTDLSRDANVHGGRLMDHVLFLQEHKYVVLMIVHPQNLLANSNHNGRKKRGKTRRRTIVVKATESGAMFYGNLAELCSLKGSICS